MTTRHRRKVAEALGTRDQAAAALTASRARLLEVGRVLSASNEDKLRKALSAIDDVLQALDKSAEESVRRNALALAEAFSSAADDATDGAYVMAMLLNLMGEESDEPDDLALLQVAYQALAQWMQIEVAEIGTPDDTTDMSDMGMNDYSQYAMAARTVLDSIDLRRLRSSGLTIDVSHHNEDESINSDACLAAIVAMNDGTSPIPESDRAAAYQHLAKHLQDAGVEAPALTEAWRAARSRMKASGVLHQRQAKALRESRLFTTDLVPLKERAVKDDGSVSLKLIAPGWGSTGFYAPDVLERDGPVVFKAGTKMFWDHSTLTEDWERPERSLRDLAAVLTTDSAWDAAGPEGAGLYADANVFAPYRETLNEIAPSIGVSIVAYGKAENGTAEGKSGQIIKELVAADSVDFVTTPGAGGKVLSLFEAARQNSHPKEVVVVEVEKDPKFVEVNARAQRAEERVIAFEAADLIAAKLRESKLPEITRDRLVEELKQKPPAKDGKLDSDAMQSRIDEAVKREIEYLAKLNKEGQISGMGVASDTEKDQTPELEKAFENLGHSKESAKVAAAGRK